MTNANSAPSLDFVFHPASIAVVGVGDESAPINSGRNFLNVLLEAGYSGQIFPVNRNGGQVRGLKIFRSLGEIPGPVDFVISAIPAPTAPQLMAECVAKGVKAVHFFTAGFSELGDESGKRLEAEVVGIARRGGVRVTGPNGMGIYCPESGLSFMSGFPKEKGPLAVMSQSGAFSAYTIREAVTRGLFISKAISYGNAADLNEADFLDYFADDPATRIVAAYIEGARAPGRLPATLKRAANLKPVVLLKGGTSPVGARSAASHTGSLAGSGAVWGAMIRQAGAIQVDDPEQLVDVALLLNYLPGNGQNVVFIGFGGGVGVHGADLCSSLGLALPEVPAEMKAKLRTIWPLEAGSSLRNPVDLFGGANKKVIGDTLSILAAWPEADFLVVHIPLYLNPASSSQLAGVYVQALVDLAGQLRERVIVVLGSVFSEAGNKIVLDAQTSLVRAGFAVFFSVPRAINALAKVVAYRQRRQGFAKFGSGHSWLEAAKEGT